MWFTCWNGRFGNTKVLAKVESTKVWALYFAGRAAYTALIFSDILSEYHAEMLANMCSINFPSSSQGARRLWRSPFEIMVRLRENLMLHHTNTREPRTTKNNKRTESRADMCEIHLLCHSSPCNSSWTYFPARGRLFEALGIRRCFNVGT